MTNSSDSPSGKYEEIGKRLGQISFLPILGGALSRVRNTPVNTKSKVVVGIPLSLAFSGALAASNAVAGQHIGKAIDKKTNKKMDSNSSWDLAPIHKIANAGLPPVEAQEEDDELLPEDEELLANMGAEAPAEEEIPEEEIPAEEGPVEEPVEETPMEEPVAEEAPMEEAPVEGEMPPEEGMMEEEMAAEGVPPEEGMPAEGGEELGNEAAMPPEEDIAAMREGTSMDPNDAAAPAPAGTRMERVQPEDDENTYDQPRLATGPTLAGIGHQKDMGLAEGHDEMGNLPSDLAPLSSPSALTGGGELAPVDGDAQVKIANFSKTLKSLTSKSKKVKAKSGNKTYKGTVEKIVDDPTGAKKLLEPAFKALGY